MAGQTAQLSFKESATAQAIVAYNKPLPVTQTTGGAAISATNPLQVAVGNTFTAGKQSFTRPADTTAYAVADLIANSTTAGSVTRLAWTGATISGAGGSGRITEFMLAKSTAVLAQIRVHLLKTDHAVTNGDNGALVLTSLNLDNKIGAIDINLVDPSNGGRIGFASGLDICYTLAATDTIYAVLEALAVFTPASEEVFTGFPKFERF